MEVIYTGLHRSPEQIAEAALQEDVQVVGLSVLSGAHNALVPQIQAALAERKMEDVLIVVGGIIPAADAAKLSEAGVGRVFGPGSKISEIVGFIQDNAATRH
jgi:methylmalonyl-CoA mutase C-terminal domain/subunit